MSTFTLGIEEEFQIIDPVTRQLKSHMSQLVDEGKVILQERIKQEMHQAVVETGTGICRNIHEAQEEVHFLRNKLIGLAAEKGLAVAAAGTHPFSDWVDQLITPHEHYDNLINEMRDVARGNLIFGLHVHVGINDRKDAMKIMNEVRYFLPHIHALSTNSPFWCGRNTGFKSYRSKVFDKFPRTGIPDRFSSIEEYDEYVAILMKTNCIDNPKKIWWDVRVHPHYPTIEYRICDIPMRAEETLCIAAICQALTAKLYKLRNEKPQYSSYRRLLVAENKWRAARDGTQARLIDFINETEKPYEKLVTELLDFIEDVVDELDCRKEVNYIHCILKNGTGADRQLRVFEEKNDLNTVVDYMIEETKFGL
ncbi:carboxylate-amine ligase [Jiulongibacter sediminis]|uniref:Putative glutamate--cysteine ligase 2 n=1 Tax=Jiulongibacter sediminis TaxID=1605367 RepID=A0A0P7BRZ0_9BACT|nr:carboxylate-amine ligase [Jiulongibacter sediminis]KPM50144.1 carboxylate--amine ligase [Jiulongibacter sediminis]TBX27159.1 carboxylate--amine ligase [Jiulongibacter sediminis]